MKYLAIFLMLLLPIIGCDDSSNSNANDDSLTSCLGFGAPSINVLVKDSLNQNVTIDTAVVSIHVQNVDSEVIEAVYIPDDDNNVDTDQFSYWALLEVNSNEFEFGIVVSEPNYHSFVTRNVSLKVDTSCGADNTIRYTVYLCPLGTSCL